MLVSTVHHTVLQRLTDHLDSGAVVPVVDRRVALDGVPDAIRALEAGEIGGEVVVRVGDAA